MYRILEFIAVANLKGGLPQGKILCLVGPPGVGKSGVARSVAKSLERKFFRISMGGMSDAAELRGHRRTYMGSYPGKLAEALKRAKSANPVVLLDEVDKVSSGSLSGGDPGAALLEVLDPELNREFSDQYLSVPLDLSRVLFICTANNQELIPVALKDRMEVINITGYVLKEKLDIVNLHLRKQLSQSTGVMEHQLSLSNRVLEHMIWNYCSEAGVRSLYNCLEQIYRKVAVMLTKDPEKKSVKVTVENLCEFIGQPEQRTTRLYSHEQPATGPSRGSPGGTLPSANRTFPVGVALGLAWSAMGGEPVYVESATRRKQSGQGSIVCTGSLGEVMRESVQIAHTVAKRYIRQYSSSKQDSASEEAANFFEDHEIHLHVPAGGTPKDGSSGGITLATALLSLATQCPVLSQVAMSGELTITGKVLPIRGVKEKVMAARSAVGVDQIILSRHNQGQVTELPSYITQGLTFHFVDTFEEVAALALYKQKTDR
eukprot:g8779.t1